MATTYARHFTTSAGTKAVSWTQRRYIVVRSGSGRTVQRTDDPARAAEAVAEAPEGVGLEVIDLETDGWFGRPRGAQPPEPEGGYLVLAGFGRVRRRHLPGSQTGTLCHPEAAVEAAGPEDRGAVCKTCIEAYYFLWRPA